MKKPNAFDRAHAAALEKASGQEAMKIIASDGRIVKAVNDALAAHDKNSKQPGWGGDSRSQVIAETVAGCLMADD